MCLGKQRLAMAYYSHPQLTVVCCWPAAACYSLAMASRRLAVAGQRLAATCASCWRWLDTTLVATVVTGEVASTSNSGGWHDKVVASQRW